jgi:putative zinc finger protein
MKCDKAQEFFSDYIESTLDEPMVVALETHLNGCEVCSADVADLRSMFTVLDKVPPVEPPADFVWRTTTRLQNELLNRREAERAKPLPWWKRMTPVAAFSYVGVAALLAIGVAFPVSNKLNSGTWGINWPFGAHTSVSPAVPTTVVSAPQFSARVPGPDGAAAEVTVTATSDMPYASAAVALLMPSGQSLVGRPLPVRNPLTVSAGQSFSLPIQMGGVFAARVSVFSMGKTFAKVLILPGAPAVAGTIQTDDPYFVLEQVAARTGQAMLVDADLKAPITLDLQNASPQQALKSVLSQLEAQSTPGASGVINITR